MVFPDRGFNLSNPDCGGDGRTNVTVTVGRDWPGPDPDAPATTTWFATATASDGWLVVKTFVAAPAWTSVSTSYLDPADDDSASTSTTTSRHTEISSHSEKGVSGAPLPSARQVCGAEC